MLVRRAEMADSPVLSHLAYRSKAHWGYSKTFLEKCIDDLIVSEDFIKINPVYVLEEEMKVIAFFSFSLIHSKLEALFIDPDFIGRGIGRKLWKDVLSKAKELNLKEFTLDSDPHAEGFYLKMGAKNAGSIQSTVFPDRYLPLMKVKVD